MTIAQSIKRRGPMREGQKYALFLVSCLLFLGCKQRTSNGHLKDDVSEESEVLTEYIDEPVPPDTKVLPLLENLKKDYKTREQAQQDLLKLGAGLLKSEVFMKNGVDSKDSEEVRQRCHTIYEKLAAPYTVLDGKLSVQLMRVKVETSVKNANVSGFVSPAEEKVIRTNVLPVVARHREDLMDKFTRTHALSIQRPKTKEIEEQIERVEQSMKVTIDNIASDLIAVGRKNLHWPMLEESDEADAADEYEGVGFKRALASKKRNVDIFIHIYSTRAAIIYATPTEKISVGQFHKLAKSKLPENIFFRKLKKSFHIKEFKFWMARRMNYIWDDKSTQSDFEAHFNLVLTRKNGSDFDASYFPEETTEAGIIKKMAMWTQEKIEEHK